MLCVFGCKNTAEGYKNNFVGKILQGRDDYFSTFIEFTTGTSGTIKNIKDMPLAKTSAKKRVLEKPNGYISFLLFSIIISLALVIYIVIKLT